MTSSKPEPAGERRWTWLLLLLALAASAWLVQRATRHPVAVTRRPELLSLVPSGPELLVTVDVESLGATGAEELLRAGGDALLGLRQRCGFEPILGLRRVVFAMPFSVGDQASGDFALIAETSLRQEPVLRCAETMIRKRGGNPVRSSLGAFTSVRDQTKPLGEVAMRADGLFIMSGGQYFRDVIDTATGAVRGDDAARVRSQVHLAMRRKLGSSQLVLTLIPGAKLPLPDVQALGLGLEVGRELELRGFVGCASEAGCSDARGLVLRMKSELG
ncbi:MAG TPA: hypothetical protein VNG33_09845, partial [Polyangiaceae bacterium]|nr:hypothetical protein [Polyangiaceae bacterium]